VAVRLIGLTTYGVGELHACQAAIPKSPIDRSGCLVHERLHHVLIDVLRVLI
jgi:hypothetical protein